MAGSATPTFYLLDADRPDHPDGRIALTGSSLSIGREADCDIALDDAKVSSRHCSLMWHGDSWRIVDLDSRNGVRVNGRQVSAGRLATGDLIQIGPRRFFFWREGEAVPTIDLATEEAARRYTESLDAAASDRRVKVEGVEGELRAEPAGSATAAMTAARPRAGESTDTALGETAAGSVATPAATDTAPPPSPATPTAAAATDAATGPATAAPEKAADPSGLEFADDSKELQLADDGPTPESLALLATHPGPLPTRPASAAATPAADSATAKPATTRRRKRATLAADIARAIPVLTFAFGLLAFAGGLLFWLNGANRGNAHPDAATAGDGASFELPDLDLLRTRMAAIEAELQKLRDRRAALETDLAEPGHEALRASLERYNEETAALAARLRDLENRLASLLDRLDQLEAALRARETGETGGN